MPTSPLAFSFFFCFFVFFFVVLFFNLEPQYLTVLSTKKINCNEIIALKRIWQVLLMELQPK